MLEKQRLMFKKFLIFSSFIQQTFIEYLLCAGIYGMRREYKNLKTFNSCPEGINEINEGSEYRVIRCMMEDVFKGCCGGVL